MNFTEYSLDTEFSITVLMKFWRKKNKCYNKVFSEFDCFVTVLGGGGDLRAIFILIFFFRSYSDYTILLHDIHIFSLSLFLELGVLFICIN